jgi:hypothetical protein
MPPTVENTRVPAWAVLNPILIRLYELGWEDPGWGRIPADQISLIATIHRLAEQIENGAVKKKFQGLAADAIAETAAKMKG